MEMIDNILQCALLCQEVYANGADSIPIGDQRYGIFTIDGVTYCAIRGTANFKNAVEDMSVWPKKSDTGCWVHGGFLDAYNELLPSIAAHLPKDGEIIFTGHSLGGAIATLLGEKYGKEVVTFGSPRVHLRGSSAPDLKHTRVIRDDDPVPMIPRVFYSHRIDPYVLKDKDHLLVQVEDHYIDGYVKAIQGVKNERV